MARALPQNLEILHAAFGVERIHAILPGDTFTLDGVEFVCAYLPESTSERFFIVKSRALVDRYLDLCRASQGARIVELGIAEGGSTALMALAAQPERLLAIDLETERLDALDEFIAARSFDDVVRPHYGIDQSDRDRLDALVEEEFDGPLDLVIDDCSHLFGPTRSSFETLFPRLRPGGRYIIEDWNAEHLMRVAVSAALREDFASGGQILKSSIRAARTADEPQPVRAPLSRLAIECMLARAQSGDVVEDVTVDEFWITVRRGSAELDGRTFRLDDAYEDHFGLKGW